MHEQSITEHGPEGLLHNLSTVVWPRPLDGPYMSPDTAVSAAVRRSKAEDAKPPHLHAPLSPLGRPEALPGSLADLLGDMAAHDAANRPSLLRLLLDGK